MKTIDFLTNKTLREQNINEEKLNVLNKVKEITTIGNSELSTVQQVANYYGVGSEAIKSIVKRNLEELTKNGYKYMKKSEILLMVQCEPIEIPNRGTGIFTKRSLLNVGMLLTGSKVAEKVREMLLDNHEQLNEVHEKLLNGEEIEIDKTSPTYFIDKEKELREELENMTNELSKAIITGNIGNICIANGKINNIKDKLTELEKEHRIVIENEKSRLIHSNKTYTITELSTECGFRSAMAMNKDLNEKGIQYKVNGTWKLYSQYENKGYTKTRQIEKNGRIIYDTRWTGVGRDWLINTIYKKSDSQTA